MTAHQQIESHEKEKDNDRSRSRGEIIYYHNGWNYHEADWDAAVLALEEKLGEEASVHFKSAESPKLHILMDWERLEGWEKGPGRHVLGSAWEIKT